ncbi:MAG: hypothetical protein LBK26_00880 [Rickettsiales bacterium]|jgi:hypothetical protein|nr:hypothetical protein [Rickettsiales bacterium]
MKRAAFTFTLFTLLHSTLLADDCIAYKTIPDVRISVPQWTKSVVQPSQPMDLLHGNVSASFIESYNLRATAEPVQGGYCVVLTGVDASVGYTDFLVQIDSRHRVGSCGYNVTLEHEDQHIAAHLTTIENAARDIELAVDRAADGIMPIFVPQGGPTDAALDRMEQELQTHPDIILMRQKINAEQEIRNKKVDQHDDGSRLNKLCGPDFG